MTLPGADELFFRPSGAEPEPDPPPTGRQRTAPEYEDRDEAAERGAARQGGGSRGTAKVRRAPKPSGRQRHDEKITVYVSGAELLALEQTRLSLRAEHGLSADRGRLVREAVAVLLADFEEHGASSMLVRRLTED
ncbi:hypothetical protein BJF83_00750 [Nocardiopsis sp. CNR-923]|uniref:hypothetical protein n=1 Tax=Nocardiopsis sp. CNR-923 TaxID=1904965 RepID=UPI000964A52F|nr:hypothetical protein [Nocardiopsis sp. CNR-923]OLT29169.1 hypothetical protein BJF83_00750 [Nocardiopsis sp. CNR-923]